MDKFHLILFFSFIGGGWLKFFFLGPDMALNSSATSEFCKFLFLTVFCFYEAKTRGKIVQNNIKTVGMDLQNLEAGEQIMSRALKK